MSNNEKSQVVKLPKAHTTEAAAVAGEIVGAVVGSAAGPPGLVAGMVVGAFAGALAGKCLDSDAQRVRAHDAELDEVIGVVGGDLGAVQPPARQPSRRGTHVAAK
jgi:hypothetical protein